MMRKLLVLSIGLAVSTMIAYGDGEGDVSLERVKANFVRVLRDANALVYSEIAKMGGVPPVADSSIRTVAESGGVSEKRVERLIRAQRADGSWIVVETGDGQVSGLAAAQDPVIYYQVMADVLERGGSHG